MSKPEIAMTGNVEVLDLTSDRFTRTGDAYVTLTGFAAYEQGGKAQRVAVPLVAYGPLAEDIAARVETGAIIWVAAWPKEIGGQGLRWVIEQYALRRGPRRRAVAAAEQAIRASPSPGRAVADRADAPPGVPPTAGRREDDAYWWGE